MRGLLALGATPFQQAFDAHFQRTVGQGLEPTDPPALGPLGRQQARAGDAMGIQPFADDRAVGQRQAVARDQGGHLDQRIGAHQARIVGIGIGHHLLDAVGEAALARHDPAKRA